MTNILIIFLSVLNLLHYSPVYRIYQPNRLHILEQNKIVSGVVKKVDYTIDGDIHIRLDVIDKSLLVKRNITKEDGCLVLEIVCGCKSIFPVCKGYKNNILVPNVGDTIITKGLFVYDKRHKINEIHPVLELTKFKEIK